MTERPAVEGPAVEGIDAERVTAWLQDNVDGAQGPFRFELIAGGRSNLTFRVTGADGTRYALRRPPVSHVLPTAHDMGREFRIISALGPTPVPVAPALGFCADESVNGRPFYVMGYVEGHIVRERAVAERVLDEAGRRRASENLIDVLVAIHAVDVDAVGLGDLGRREGYIERQLKRWYAQFQQSIDGRDRKVAVVDEVHELLAGRVPQQGRPTIVHGDYRLDNTMLGEDGAVRAVLDWELCTLGDPLADLGLLNVYWSEAGNDSPILAGATSAPGFLSRAEINQRYAARAGRDVSELPFYVAFGYWKLACILEGVLARYEGGAMGGDRAGGTEGLGQQVASLAEMARDAAAQL